MAADRPHHLPISSPFLSEPESHQELASRASARRLAFDQEALVGKGPRFLDVAPPGSAPRAGHPADVQVTPAHPLLRISGTQIRRDVKQAKRQLEAALARIQRNAEAAARQGAKNVEERVGKARTKAYEDYDQATEGARAAAKTLARLPRDARLFLPAGPANQDLLRRVRDLREARGVLKAFDFMPSAKTYVKTSAEKELKALWKARELKRADPGRVERLANRVRAAEDELRISETELRKEIIKRNVSPEDASRYRSLIFRAVHETGLPGLTNLRNEITAISNELQPGGSTPSIQSMVLRKSVLEFVELKRRVTKAWDVLGKVTLRPEELDAEIRDLEAKVAAARATGDKGPAELGTFPGQTDYGGLNFKDMPTETVIWLAADAKMTVRTLPGGKNPHNFMVEAERATGLTGSRVCEFARNYLELSAEGRQRYRDYYRDVAQTGGPPPSLGQVVQYEQWAASGGANRDEAKRLQDLVRYRDRAARIDAEFRRLKAQFEGVPARETAPLGLASRLLALKREAVELTRRMGQLRAANDPTREASQAAYAAFHESKSRLADQHFQNRAEAIVVEYFNHFAGMFAPKDLPPGVLRQIAALTERKEQNRRLKPFGKRADILETARQIREIVRLPRLPVDSDGNYLPETVGSRKVAEQTKKFWAAVEKSSRYKRDKSAERADQQALYRRLVAEGLPPDEAEELSRKLVRHPAAAHQAPGVYGSSGEDVSGKTRQQQAMDDAAAARDAERKIVHGLLDRERRLRESQRAAGDARDLLTQGIDPVTGRPFVGEDPLRGFRSIDEYAQDILNHKKLGLRAPEGKLRYLSDRLRLEYDPDFSPKEVYGSEWLTGVRGIAKAKYSQLAEAIENASSPQELADLESDVIRLFQQHGEPSPLYEALTQSIEERRASVEAGEVAVGTYSKYGLPRGFSQSTTEAAEESGPLDFIERGNPTRSTRGMNRRKAMAESGDRMEYVEPDITTFIPTAVDPEEPNRGDDQPQSVTAPRRMRGDEEAGRHIAGAAGPYPEGSEVVPTSPEERPAGGGLAERMLEKWRAKNQ